MKQLFRQLGAFIEEHEVVAIGLVAVIFMLYVEYVHDRVIAWTVSLLLS